MARLNQCNFIGRTGKDVELRYTTSGVAVASVSVAVSEKFKDKNGERQERTEWINVVAWRNLAETMSKYLTKGQLIFISGKIQTRKYQDRDGNDRYITEIVADQMQMLGSRNDEGSGSTGEHRPPQEPQRPAQDQRHEGDTFDEPPFNPDDDIPF